MGKEQTKSPFQIPERAINVIRLGIELALQTINIETADWGWKTNFNISFNRNRIESLSYGEDVIYSTNNVFALARVNEPVGVFYVWRALGVYENDAANVWTDPETGQTRKVLKGSMYGDAFGGGDMIWPYRHDMSG